MPLNTSTLTIMARGMVAAQPTTIFLSMETFSSLSSPTSRPTMPTPMTAPTKQCDVETARPNIVLESTATAVPIWTEKERDGVSFVILPPTVSIVRRPSSAIPTTKPPAPRSNTHVSISGGAAMSPLEAATKTAARGPIELPRSLPPCAKAMAESHGREDEQGHEGLLRVGGELLVGRRRRAADLVDLRLDLRLDLHLHLRLASSDGA